MKTYNIFKILLIVIILFNIGCSKDGAPGPKGDPGTIGPKGDKGDEGDTGPQGEKGTANVIYSNWMDFDWNANDDLTFKQMTIDVPEITEEFLEEGGVVLLYLKANSSTGLTVMVQLPYLSGNDHLYAAVAIVPSGTIPSVDFENGIIINLESIDGTTEVADYQDVSGTVNYDLRYILIPGGIPASNSGRYSLRSMDYDSVQKMFNIPD